MKLVQFLFLILFGISASALAQNCPNGIPSGGNPLCIPPDQPNSPYYNGAPTSSSQKVAWAARWGAIATDVSKRALGGATGLSSKRKAQKAAIAACQVNGGVACKIDVAYVNQCAVIVTGDNRYVTAHAPNIGEATSIGMERCGREDVNCRVHYTDCSYPEQVR